MTNPQLSITVSDESSTRRSIGRVYQLPTGDYPQKMRYAKAAEALSQNKVFPSITNIVSAKAIDLTGWAKFMMRKSIMEQWKDFNGSNLSSILSKAQKANDDYTTLACDKGSEVHLAAEEHILTGKTDHGFQFGGDPYYESFLQFCDDFKPKFISIETTVYGKTEDNLYYAGTIDFIAEINGKIVAGDWKTSKVLHEEVGIQLVAGMKAQKMVSDDGESLEEMIKVDKAIGVHLTADGYYVSEVNNLQYCWDTFQSLRRVWEWNAFNGNFQGNILKAVSSPEDL